MSHPGHSKTHTQRCSGRTTAWVMSPPLLHEHCPRWPRLHSRGEAAHPTLCLHATTFTSAQSGRWEAFLCLTLFSAFWKPLNLYCYNWLKAYKQFFTSLNKAQDLDTKLRKPFTPLSPHTESPLATQRCLVPPDLSISAWLVTPNPSQTAFWERHSLPSPGCPCSLSPYVALNLFNLFHKAEGLLRAKAPVCHMKRQLCPGTQQAGPR